MNRSISRILRLLSSLPRMPGKIPGSFILDAAEFGAYVGTTAAEHQLTTGFLGQSGSFGGGVWEIDSVDREFEFVRAYRKF